MYYGLSARTIVANLRVSFALSRKRARPRLGVPGLCRGVPGEGVGKTLQVVDL
jgi:hypothetical protein